MQILTESLRPEIVETIEDFFRPKARLGMIDWGIEHVKPPNSARSADGFSIAGMNYLRDPIEASGDPEVREMVFLAPTGAGKTTLADVKIPHMMSEDTGSILVSMQSDPDADAYFDERLEPICLGVDRLAKRIAMLPRSKKRKGEWYFPDRTVYVKGPSLTTFQRKSVRLVLVDEAWRLKHGYFGEARARTHNRWNRLVIFVSQGGVAQVITENGKRVKSDLEDAWLRTDRQEYTMVCPECGERHRWKMRHKREDKQIGGLTWESSNREDGSFDEAALAQSVRYVCPGRCGTKFEDVPHVRIALDAASIYVPSNLNYVPHPHGHHRGFHVPCLALPHESWADIALQWTRASHAWHQGDREPRKIFVQKRLAENFREEEEVEQTALILSKYRKSEYVEGAPWDGELCRFLTVDVQKDHFWVVVRAWKVDGSSRLLYEGKALTWESLRELQTQYKIRDFFAFIDCKHKGSEVEAFCAQHKWFALEGDKASDFAHYPPNSKCIRKYYSPVIKITIPGAGICHKVRWSNVRMKDILTNLRSGHGALFEIPEDASKAYREHMISEIKRPVISKTTKEVSERYTPIGDRENHLWDCESMQITAACIRKIIRAIVDTEQPQRAT